MWTLTKQFRFEASHQLTEHDGKCRRLHGHSWVGRVVVRGRAVDDVGPKRGMLVDYSVLGAIVSKIVEEHLDHYHLNESLGIYPTSELIAKWVFEEVLSALLDIVSPRDVELVRVEIDETCTASCSYSVS